MSEFTNKERGNVDEQTEEMKEWSENVSPDMVPISEEPEDVPSDMGIEQLDFVDELPETADGEGDFADSDFAENFEQAVSADGEMDENASNFSEDSYLAEEEIVSPDEVYEEDASPDMVYEEGTSSDEIYEEGVLADETCEEDGQEYMENYLPEDEESVAYEADGDGDGLASGEDVSDWSEEDSEYEAQPQESLEESLAAIAEIEAENAPNELLEEKPADTLATEEEILPGDSKPQTGKKKAAKAKNKKVNEKKAGKKEKKAQKGDVPFFLSIRFKLIAAFLVPVIGIIILGVASYSKASNALVENYKGSVQQTVNMMQEYISLVVTSEKDEFKTYLTKEELSQYFNRALSEEQMGTIRNDYVAIVRNKMALDTKISGFYFLYDNRKSIYVAANFELPDDAYSAYLETEQGAKVGADKTNWLVFGQNPDADAALHIPTDGYSLRLVRKFNDASACIMVDFDDGFIREAMQSMDPGEGGYVAMVTSDGAEFYSDEETALEEPLVYGTDFYTSAMESEEDSGATEVMIGGQEYLFVYSKLQTGDVLVCSLVPSARILAETKDIKQLSMILIIVASVVALGLGMLISSQMSGTIKYILRQLRKVAKGDLTIQLTSRSKDEFRLLCDGINNTVEHVKDLIVHVNEVSTQLNDAAAYVSEASGTFMETSHDIQKAVSEIEVGVNRLDMGSADCLSQMDSLSGKIANVSTNADEIGKLTSTTGETINTGIESVQGLTSSAASTTRITQSVIEAIEELEQKSKSINKIVSSINDIAEQTNLLSLNASIEAARAGEAGKGFSVVAEEIRKLSDQCLKSSGQINSIVNEIVGKTKEVVAIAREAEAVVSTQAGAVEETTSSFRRIDQQVEHLLLALATISDNVQDMNSSRSETLEAIESISAVSAETAACSTSVYSTAGTQLNAVEDLDDAAQQLRRRADKLVEVLSTFTV